jgi:hypothetical protein
VEAVPACKSRGVTEELVDPLSVLNSLGIEFCYSPASDGVAGKISDTATSSEQRPDADTARYQKTFSGCHDFAPVRRFILEVLMLTHFGQNQIH